MPNSVPTKRQSPPSLRKLLLLTAYALSASSKISTVSSVINGQPSQRLNAQSKAVDFHEERFFAVATNAVQTVKKFANVAAMRLHPVKVAYIDKLFREKIDFSVPSLYTTPEFKEVASKIIDVHLTWKGAIKALFKGLVRASSAAEHREDSRALDELAHQIGYFKGHPELPIPDTLVHGFPAYESIVDFNWRRSVMLSLEAHLLKHWMSKGRTPDDIYTLLHIDITSSTFFEDPNVLLWIDYLAEHTKGVSGGSFELVLHKFQQLFSDSEIAKKVVDAGALDKPGSVAEGLMLALTCKLVDCKLQPDNFLRNKIREQVFRGEAGTVPDIFAHTTASEQRADAT